MGSYISIAGLRSLANYKYRGEDHSTLARLFLNDFWNFVLKLTPRTIAPNAITVSGLILLLIHWVLLIYYSPNLFEEGPRWLYLSYALSIFIYQTLDNIDGKQARRTGSCSALGELFDHGCDSLFPTFAVLAVFNAGNTGPLLAFIGAQFGILPFYLAHFEEYHTGILILGEYANPTEVEILLCLIHLLVFLFGRGIWEYTIGDVLSSESIPAVIRNITILQAGVAVAFAIAAPVAIWAILGVVRFARNNNKSYSQAFMPMMPLVYLLTVSSFWLYFSPASFLYTYPIWTLTFYGLIASYLVDMLIIDRICNMEFNAFNPILLIPTVALLNALIFPHNPEQEYYLMIALTIILVVVFIHMVVSVIHELSSHLNIPVFTLPSASNSSSNLSRAKQQ